MKHPVNDTNDDNNGVASRGTDGTTISGDVPSNTGSDSASIITRVPTANRSVTRETTRSSVESKFADAQIVRQAAVTNDRQELKQPTPRECNGLSVEGGQQRLAETQANRRIRRVSQHSSGKT